MRHTSHRDGYSHYFFLVVHHYRNQSVIYQSQILVHELLLLLLGQCRESEDGRIGLVEQIEDLLAITPLRDILIRQFNDL